jgi:hypothetical protein
METQERKLCDVCKNGLHPTDWQAATNGHFHCLTYLHESGQMTNAVFWGIANSGDMDCLKYAYSVGLRPTLGNICDSVSAFKTKCAIYCMEMMRAETPGNINYRFLGGVAHTTKNTEFLNYLESIGHGYS